MIRIRQANPGDPKDLAGILAAATEFAHFADRPDLITPGSYELDQAIVHLLGTPGVRVLVAEDDIGVLGGLGYGVTPFIWDRTKLMAEEIFWWTSPAAPASVAMKLMRAAKEDWKSAGVSVFVLNKMENSDDRVGRVYEHMGAAKAHTVYIGAM